MTDEEKLIFSANLRSIMGKKNINQKELAKLVGCSPATVQNWCAGKKAARNFMGSLCKALGCTEKELLTDPQKTKNGYYMSEDTADAAQKVYTDPYMHALFDAAKDARPSDILYAADLLTRLKRTNPDG